MKSLSNQIKQRNRQYFLLIQINNSVVHYKPRKRYVLFIEI